MKMARPRTSFSGQCPLRVESYDVLTDLGGILKSCSCLISPQYPRAPVPYMLNLFALTIGRKAPARKNTKGSKCNHTVH